MTDTKTPIAPQRKRLDWIDALRAFAMLLVVVVHASLGLDGWNVYTVLTGAIMIPLFFVISGYLFNPRGGEQLPFFKNLFFKMVIPWLFISQLWLQVIYIPSKGFSFWLDLLWDLIRGDALWFIPACIIGEIIFFYIRKFFKNPLAITASCLAFLVGGLILAHFDLLNFAMINRAMVAQGFFLIGYLYRVFEPKIKDLPLYIPILGVLLYVGMGILALFLWEGCYIDVHHNIYLTVSYGVITLPYTFLMTVLGCFSLFALLSRCPKIPKPIVYLGQNTLLVYGFHTLGFRLIQKAFNLVSITLPANWLTALLDTLLSIIGCLIFAYFINRFLPELVGKKRKKKEKKAEQ